MSATIEQMFVYKSFDSEYKLADFINVNKIKQEQIVNIVFNPKEKEYILFYWKNYICGGGW